MIRDTDEGEGGEVGQIDSIHRAQKTEPMTHRRFAVGFSCMAVVYAVLLVLVYRQGWAHMVARWGSDDYSHAWLVPPVIAYLLWTRRETIARVPGRPTWWGLVPLLVGIALYWLGELGGEYFTLYVSSWFAVLGLVWLHLGWGRVRALVFPLVLGLTLFPLPSFLHTKVTLGLQLLASRTGVALMRLGGMTAYREGNVIDLGFTQLQVVEACSGLRYVFPLLTLGLVLAYFYRAAWWKRALLVLSTVPVAVVTNGVRIALTGVLIERWGPTVAEGRFHDFAGWVVFMVSLGMLVGEMWVFSRLGVRNGEKAKGAGGLGATGVPAHRAPPTVHFLVAALLLAATAVTTAAVDFRERVPLARALAGFPLQLGPWQGRMGLLGQNYLDALDLTDYALVEYRNAAERQVHFYVAYYETQSKGESIHSPETCLPGSGWVFRVAGEAVAPTPGYHGGSLPVGRAVMEKMGDRQLVYFWFPARGRVLTNLWELKLYTFWDALTRRRTDGALVRVVTPVGSDETLTDAEVRLQGFTRLVVPALGEFLPGEETGGRK